MDVTPAHLSAAADALDALLPLDRPADVVLSAWFRSRPRLGARDRAFIADAVFAVLRHLRRLEAVTGTRAARKLLLAALVLVQGRAVRSLSAATGAEESRWLSELKAADTALPAAVRFSLPDWLYDALVATLPPDALEPLARKMLVPAPLDLRVNTLRANREEVIATLNAEGIEAIATALSPIGIRLAGKPALERHALFTGGQVEVQDEGSQLVAYLMQAKRGEMVVDFCAGAGGKTLALGAMMRSEGRLYAFDTSDRRLANLKVRLKRSGLSNVHPQLIASETDARIKRLAGKIDAVLVDAPCSGTGTLRRNPDLKWRMNPDAIVELGTKQGNILASAARLPKIGGRLVYATCSLLPDENERVVETFLAAHPGWKRMDVGPVLARQGIAVTAEANGMLRLYPHVHGTDGFFAALLERHA